MVKTITMRKFSFLTIIIIFIVVPTCVIGKSKISGHDDVFKDYPDHKKDYLDFIGYCNLQPVFRNAKNNQIVKMGTNNELISVIDTNFRDYEPFYYCDYGYCKVLKTNRKQIVIHANAIDYKFTLPSIFSSVCFSTKMDTLYYDDPDDGFIKYYILKTKKTLSTHIKGSNHQLCKGFIYYTRGADNQRSGDVEMKLYKSNLTTFDETMIQDDIFEDSWLISPDGRFLIYCLGDGYRLFKIGPNVNTILDIPLSTDYNIVYYDYENKNFVFMNGSNLSKKIIKLN